MSAETPPTSGARSAWVDRDGLLWSPALSALGLVAGFTTKRQGSMAGSHHPLEEQARNRAALAKRLGFAEVVRTRQVHGRAVVRTETQVEPWPVADAQWTDRPGVLLGIAAADCLPILVGDPGGPIGGAHAGWQGTTLRVAEVLVEALVAGGAVRERLVAAIGPSIGPCCYTVDEERAEIVRERIGDGALRRAGNAEGRSARGRGAPVSEAKPSLTGAFVFDLWEANAAQLRAAGVLHIEQSGLCTRSGGVDVWSYRGRAADGAYGTQLGFIGRPAV